MWDRLKRRLKGEKPRAVPEGEVSPAQAHVAFWGTAGHEVRKRGASVSGGLFAVWHFPPVKGRPLGAYVTLGLAQPLGVEFFCLTSGPSDDPFDDPFARLLMEAGLFKSPQRPVLGHYDVIPLSEDALPDTAYRFALYAPSARFTDMSGLEQALGAPLVLVLPVTGDELQLISIHGAERFVDELVAQRVAPLANGRLPLEWPGRR